MIDEIIESAPLDIGDPVAMDTFVNQPGAIGGQMDGDIVAIAVPVGKGLILQRWLERQCLGAGEG